MKMDRLIEICEQYQLPSDCDVVLPEAYIPYIPPNWNGCLILGEAQNLSNTYEAYVAKLEKMTKRERITRLQGQNNLGIMPWDDGSLKVALKAAACIDPETAAVSNAVLWSQTYNKTTNKNPSKTIEKHSAALWDQMLEELRPSRIVTSGAVARRVVEKTAWTTKYNSITHPNAMRFKKAEKSVSDLLLEYPVVEQTIKKHPLWIRGNRKSIIRFACHVYNELVEN